MGLGAAARAGLRVLFPGGDQLRQERALAMWRGPFARGRGFERDQGATFGMRVNARLLVGPLGRFPERTLFRTNSHRNRPSVPARDTTPLPALEVASRVPSGAMAVTNAKVGIFSNCLGMASSYCH